MIFWVRNIFSLNKYQFTKKSIVSKKLKSYNRFSLKILDNFFFVDSGWRNTRFYCVKYMFVNYILFMLLTKVWIGFIVWNLLLKSKWYPRIKFTNLFLIANIYYKTKRAVCYCFRYIFRDTWTALSPYIY